MLLPFFLIIELYFLIPAVITQIFNPIVELAVPIGILTKEAKAEMETHPALVEIAISESSMYFKTIQTFLCFSIILVLTFLVLFYCSFHSH